MQEDLLPSFQSPEEFLKINLDSIPKREGK
jgi:hypothetical protein